MSLEIQIGEAVEFIRSRWSKQPNVAIVLGTGSGEIADNLQIDQTIDYGQIPNFPQSTALGHKGQLVCGSFADQPVVAMQGRFHLYEGYPYEQITLPIHVLCSLGINKLLVSNAAGGLNPKYRSADIMLLTSHLDFMYRSTSSLFAPQPASGSNATPRFTSQPDRQYDLEMIELAEQVARQNNFVVHRGVYAGLQGPNYETRAEYRMLRRIGADVAGMSTIPEVTVAQRYAVRVLAASIVSNVAKPDVLEPTSGQEVIDAAKLAAPKLLKIFAAATIN